MKKSYLNNSWKNISKHLSDLAENGKIQHGDALISKFNAYRQQVMGFFHPSWMEQAEQLGKKFAEWRWDNHPKLHKPGMTREAFVQQGQQLYNKLFELNYLTNMGFKPYLPIRNMTQIYTTLAPRVTNESVDKAVKYVVDNEEAVYSYLQRVGVINNKAPLVNLDNPGVANMAKFTERSLRWFKNSDEFTRAVAFFSAKQNFDDAVVLYKQGSIKTKEQFFDWASLQYTADDIRENIWKQVNAGMDAANPNGSALIDAAGQLHGSNMAQDTMFLYRQRMSPEFFKETFVGKLFGQYGTYSAGYLQTITGAMRNAKTPMARAAYIARFLTNHGALFALTTALGIRASNFVPFAPATFTGGPFFDIAYNTVKSLDLGYRGAQARSELLRSVSQLVPGSAQARILKRSIDFANEGETYKAWLSLTAAPVNTR